MYGNSRSRLEPLFFANEWHAFQNSITANLASEVAGLNADRLLNTPTGDWVNYLVQKYSIDVPKLQVDRMLVDQAEAQIDVSQDPLRGIRDRSRPFIIAGVKITAEVPYEGDAKLFSVRPEEFRTVFPRAVVRDNLIEITVERIDPSVEEVRKIIDEVTSDLQWYLRSLEKSAANLNAQIPGLAKSHVEQRKSKLLRDRNLVAELGYPVKKREGVSHTYAAPEIQRKKITAPPSTSSVPFTPEPTLPLKEYEEILDTMDGMATVMERSPSAFETLDEEALRTHFLVRLNENYVSQATAETFNHKGKTDIFVTSKGHVIFIAECKFWKGEKNFIETLDQLLGYLTWRDTKAAVVVFSRNDAFSNVLEKIEEVTPKHQQFKSLIRKRSETSWQYRFAREDDPNREMFITVMAFNVPRAC